MKTTKNLNIWLAMSMFLMAMVCTATGGTIYVDAADGSDDNDGLSPETALVTIQKAIDAAKDGDTVLVADGTYTGTDNSDIDFLGKAITVRGENGPDSCIIDCQNLGRGFHFHHGENANSILDGLTVTNGYGRGGGIYISRSSPTITNCIIRTNSTEYGHNGGGMHVRYGSPTITNCIITGNSASSGGGVDMFESSTTLTNCIITGNLARNSGGGIKCSYNSSPTITNCTITGNLARSNGGGIQCFGNSRPTITNCILCGNLPQQIYTNYSSSTSVSYSNVQGGWGGEANINKDPSFAFNTDYHLMPNSPCIDAGTNHPPGGLAATDLDGSLRSLDGDGDGTTMADMGAYEYNVDAPTIALSSDGVTFSVRQGGPNPDDKILLVANTGGAALYWELTEHRPWLSASPTVGELAAGAVNEVTITIDASGLTHGLYACVVTILDPQATNSPRTLTLTLNVTSTLHVPAEFTTIQQAIDAAIDGDVILVANGTYTGLGNRDLDFHGKALTMRSENGPKNCIIDCDGTEKEPHRGFYFHSFEDANSIVDGFTITNGYLQSGGGVYCYPSSPAITNCTIIGNTVEYDGGGIYCEHGGATITNCTIMNNVAKIGGAIRCEFTATPSINNCVITNNKAETGGGIYCSAANITNCIITGNAASAGGGIYASGYFTGSRLKIGNCTFSANTATLGGAILCGELSSPSMVNCILWGDSATSGPEIAGGSGDWGAALSVSYSDVQGGQDGVAAYGWFDLSWGTRNIDLDPCFAEPGYWADADEPNIVVEPNDPNSIWIEGDYHLLSDSPCIDAGDPNYMAEPNETDLDGKPRVLDGYNDGVLVVDMGAYESPIFAEARIVPRTISLESRGKWITAFLWLPEGYAVTDMADIDSHSLLLDYEIEPERFRINEEKQVVMARFSQEEVQTFLNVGDFEPSISLQLMDGTVFEGRDLIRVTSKRGGKPDKYVQESNPNPADGATDVDINADLSWTAGSDATSHDVYFGTSSPPPFVCNQTAITFDPGTMDYETRYYWRIDEVNKWGVSSGEVWSFTTRAAPPKPAGLCFPGDTPVWVNGALVQISRVSARQKVGKLESAGLTVCLKQIESVEEYDGTYVCHDIVLETGNRITVVDSHRFLVDSGQWVPPQNLRNGTRLVSLKGTIGIKSIVKRHMPFVGKVYNLKIKGGDRYFVGKDGVAVRDY